VLVGVWSGFNVSVFENLGFHLGLATAYSVGIVILLVFIILLVVLIRYYFILFSFEEQRISNLIEMLHGIKFSLNNSYYMDQFKDENLNKLIKRIIEEYELTIKI
ncbi:hypothetical protein SB781_31335, partial [Paraburkholderia sp. SIMBA_061]